MQRNIVAQTEFQADLSVYRVASDTWEHFRVQPDGTLKLIYAHEVGVTPPRSWWARLKGKVTQFCG